LRFSYSGYINELSSIGIDDWSKRTEAVVKLLEAKKALNEAVAEQLK
jgi:hypothetical protein